MLIRKIIRKDIPQVAYIHFQFLKSGIISHLGESFLQNFYKSLLKQNSTFTIVAVSGSKIIGFATGATNLKTIPIIMIFGLWSYTFISVIKNPIIAIKLLQMPFYPSFKSQENIGEIFSLAVIPAYRRQRVGAKLVDSCKREFKKMGYSHFQVSVRKEMHTANRFYINIKLKKKASAKFLNEKIIFYGN